MAEGHVDHCRKGNAVLVTMVGLLEASADGDHSIGVRYLQLKVGIVGNSHELRETLPPEHGKVAVGEVHHLFRVDLNDEGALSGP